MQIAVQAIETIVEVKPFEPLIIKGLLNSLIAVIITDSHSTDPLEQHIDKLVNSSAKSVCDYMQGVKIAILDKEFRGIPAGTPIGFISGMIPIYYSKRSLQYITAHLLGLMFYKSIKNQPFIRMMADNFAFECGYYDHHADYIRESERFFTTMTEASDDNEINATDFQSKKLMLEKLKEKYKAAKTAHDLLRDLRDLPAVFRATGEKPDTKDNNSSIVDHIKMYMAGPTTVQ